MDFESESKLAKKHSPSLVSEVGRDLAGYGCHKRVNGKAQPIFILDWERPPYAALIANHIVFF